MFRYFFPCRLSRCLAILRCCYIGGTLRNCKCVSRYSAWSDYCKFTVSAKRCASSLKSCAMSILILTSMIACARDDEAAQRAWLGQWFALGETISFSATRGCAVGLYAVVTGQVKSALPVTRNVARMRREIAGRGAAALDVPGQAADAALVAMTNHHRATGIAMRRAGLEARACMDVRSESAFRHALDDSSTVLGWDGTRDALLLLMPGEGLLVVAMGEG